MWLGFVQLEMLNTYEPQVPSGYTCWDIYNPIPMPNTINGNNHEKGKRRSQESMLNRINQRH